MSNSIAYGGANMPIDPVQPLIDLRYNEQKIKADISIDANNYLGNIFTSLGDGYGADIYYDNDGHFRFNALTDIFFVDGYKYVAPQWEYTNLSEANCQYNFDGLNAVTVYTNLSVDTQALVNAQEESKTQSDDTDKVIEDEDIQAPNLSYTAYNVNPLSPIRVGAVGLRRMESTSTLSKPRRVLVKQPCDIASLVTLLFREGSALPRTPSRKGGLHLP